LEHNFKNIPQTKTKVLKIAKTFQIISSNFISLAKILPIQYLIALKGFLYYKAITYMYV